MAKPSTRSHNTLAILYLLVTGLGVGWLTGLAVSPVVSTVIASVTASAAAIVAALSGLDDDVDVKTNADKKRRFDWQVKAWPLMVLVIGIALGAVIGIIARNNHWFGSSVSAEIAQWTAVGIDEAEVTTHLFEQHYPSPSHTRPYTQTLSWIGGDLTAEIKRWTDAGLTKEEAARRLFEVEYSVGESRSIVNLDSSAGMKPSQEESAAYFGSILFATGVQEECKTLISLAEKGRYGDLQTELRSSPIVPLRELSTIVTDTVKLAEIVEQVLCIDISS